MSDQSANLDAMTNTPSSEMKEKKQMQTANLDILKCPKCSGRLEALELEHYTEDCVEYQKIVWMCKGVQENTCTYPVDIDFPMNVFWTKRTMEQKRKGFLPLPRIHLLPEQHHYLYPKFFATKRSFELCLVGENKSKRKRGLETPLEAAPSTSGSRNRSSDQSLSTSFIAGKTAPISSKRKATDRALKSSTNSPCSSPVAPPAASRCTSVETVASSAILSSCSMEGSVLGKAAISAAPSEHSSAEDLHLRDASASKARNTLETSASQMESSGKVLPTQSSTSDSSKSAAPVSDNTPLSKEYLMPMASLPSVSNENKLRKDDSDSDESVRVVVIDEESDEETDNMQTGTHSHNDLALYRSLLSQSQQESDTDILPKRIRSFKALCKYILEIPPCESNSSLTADDKGSAKSFAGECERLLKEAKILKKKMACLPRHSIRPREGEPSPFEPWMLQRCGMFESSDWRKPVRLTCGTAVDAFVTTYNLLYNRDNFVSAVNDEMRRHNMYNYDPTLPLRQQRMMARVLQSWDEKDGEVQFEELKKMIDVNALRLQVINGVGVTEVMHQIHMIEAANRIGKQEAGGDNDSNTAKERFCIIQPSCSSKKDATVGEAGAMSERISPDTSTPAPEEADRSCWQETAFPQKTETNDVLRWKVQEYVDMYVREFKSSTQKTDSTKEDEDEVVDTVEEPSSLASDIMATSEDCCHMCDEFDPESDFILDY
uniref:Uncharacterized protein n=2 Tax=Parascaris univalens TaxID=6257 RepID=A0A915C3Z6_PARUN